MKMCKRAALCAVTEIKVESVSTAAHTAASVSFLTWKELSKYSKAVSQDEGHTYSNSIRSVTFSDGRVLGAGDYLNISISGVNYQADIIGFHHDTVTDSAAYGGTCAGITWQMHDCYATTYKLDADANNWKTSDFRTIHVPTFLGWLPSSLTGVIVSVDKLTAVGNKISDIETTGDTLFLLSEIEIFGSRKNSFAGEGTQYAYYAAGNSTIKTRGGSAEIWLERSPETDHASYICLVYLDGTRYYYSLTSGRGIALAFCT